MIILGENFLLVLMLDFDLVFPKETLDPKMKHVADIILELEINLCYLSFFKISSFFLKFHKLNWDQEMHQFQ